MTQPQPGQYGPDSEGRHNRVLTAIFNVLRESEESLARLAPLLPRPGTIPNLDECDPDYPRQAELTHTDVYANLVISLDLILYHVAGNEEQQHELSLALYHLNRANQERYSYDYAISQVYLELALGRMKNVAEYVAKIKNFTPPAP